MYSWQREMLKSPVPGFVHSLGNFLSVSVWQGPRLLGSRRPPVGYSSHDWVTPFSFPPITAAHGDFG